MKSRRNNCAQFCDTDYWPLLAEQETCINLALGLGQVSRQPYGAIILDSVLKVTVDSTFFSRSRVVSPVLDVIDWKTFQYFPSKDLQRGVLDWKLDFHWEPLADSERKALPSPISPIR